MIFGRREAASWSERVMVALWPRRSWGRSLRYALLRLQRLDASPHALALGVAIGVFASFQPILGIQMLFAGAVAWMLNASIGAALIGTFVGTPITWPIMWLGSYHLGALVIGETRSVTLAEIWSVLSAFGASANAHALAAGGLFWQVIYPLAVGAVPLGLLSGALFYVMVRRATEFGRR